MGTSGVDGAWGSPARVTREQYVHFATLAHERGDAADWPSFRIRLLAALDAACGASTPSGVIARQLRTTGSPHSGTAAPWTCWTTCVP